MDLAPSLEIQVGYVRFGKYIVITSQFVNTFTYLKLSIGILNAKYHYLFQKQNSLTDFQK